MPVDFCDAAGRHWEDANYLYSNGRLANADHLYGLSAECALKAVMIGLGMLIDSDGSPSDRSYKVHINKLWDEFISFASERSEVRYLELINIPNAFVNWDVNQRYNHRTDVTQEIADSHKIGATATNAALVAAILDGVVS